MANWSVPSSGGWSLLHDVAILYLSCMHGQVERVDDADSSAIKDLIKSRSTTDVGADRVFDEAMLVYVGFAGGEMVAASIASLGQHLSQAQRRDLLTELKRVASADDGIVHPTEASLLGEIAAVWGLSGSQGDSPEFLN